MDFLLLFALPPGVWFLYMIFSNSADNHYFDHDDYGSDGDDCFTSEDSYWDNEYDDD